MQPRPSQSLHGGLPAVPERELNRSAGQLAAEQRAREILADPDLGRLLTAPREANQIERARQVFVNRNLRMSNVELIGFDMDYTLAIYHMRRIEQLSFDMTLARLVSDRGYPKGIGSLRYDHGFVIRGLVVDKSNGNLIKMDRFGHVGRAYHGLRPLEDDERRRLYRNERIELNKNPRYAWIDTLFALPEAYLYAGIIDQLDAVGVKVDHEKLYDDIRECIDTVHRDNSLKAEIIKDIGHYIFKDPELGPALHKLRSGGKKLFLLTNSLWDYTEVVMRYLLDGVVPEYPSWRNYFDWVVTGASKPAFFSEPRPFLEVDQASGESRPMPDGAPLERGKIYQGGNLPGLQKGTGFAADRVLYVGDHIFGDILRSKKTSLWRTCMVVQEIEDEINYTDGRHEKISTLSEIELLLARPGRRGERAQDAAEPPGPQAGPERQRGRGARGDGGRAPQAQGRPGAAAARPQGVLGAGGGAGGRRGGGLQPLLGAAVQGGEREQPLRGAGGAVRVHLHQPRLQPPPLLADAVLPLAARPDAARARRRPLREALAAGQRGPDARVAREVAPPGSVQLSSASRWPRSSAPPGRSAAAGSPAAWPPRSSSRTPCGG